MDNTVPVAIVESAARSAQLLRLSPRSLDPHVVGVAIFKTLPAPGSYQLLLLKRAKEEKDFAGAWEIPGGHIEESDETVLHAVVRETREETGQEIEAVLGRLDYMTWESSSGVSNVQLNYVVSISGGNPLVLSPKSTANGNG